MTSKIAFFPLVLLIVAAIDSIRNLPASALFGSTLIFFFLFAAVVFLIPTAFVAAELSATFPEEGGVYHWVRKAFGEKWAMLAIWLQWMNTMIWYPTILSFIAGSAAYLVHPQLAQDKTYLVAMILTVFWTLTFLNMYGLHVSTRINGLCAMIGTILPLTLLIILGVFWVLKGYPLQIRLAKDTLLPSLTEVNNWVALISIMASFLGIELAGVHVKDICSPQRNFPKALLCASAFILFSMLFGSLSIALVVPEEKINLVAGIMQVFTTFLHTFGLAWAIPILTALIVTGAIGGLINWLISPAKGLLHAAEFGFLPRFFTQKNQYGVAARILLAQAILVSCVCLAFLLVPSVNGLYWFLTALSTQLYMVMYVLIFFSALYLHYCYPNRSKTFKIPGRTFGMWLTCLLGLFGCLATIVVSFVPPANVDVGSPLRYICMIAGGNFLAIAPISLFFIYRKKMHTS